MHSKDKPVGPANDNGDKAEKWRVIGTNPNSTWNTSSNIDMPVEVPLDHVTRVHIRTLILNAGTGAAMVTSIGIAWREDVIQGRETEDGSGEGTIHCW